VLHPSGTLVRRNAFNGDVQSHRVEEPCVTARQAIFFAYTGSIVGDVMSNHDTRYIRVTERHELLGICTLVEEPRGYPGVPSIGRCRASEDSVGVISGHCLDIEYKHGFWFSVMVRKFDVLAKARTVRVMVIFGPTSLDLPLIGKRWKLRSHEVNGEDRPWLRRARPKTVKMLVNGMALERW
jgi:hypothetical protein